MTKCEPIKGGVSGCLNCGYTESKLSMRLRLYNNFGGWQITKNGELFFTEDVNKDFRKSKTLLMIEKQARLEPEEDWKAIFDSGLRGAVYQRQGLNKWVLVEKNKGFA